MDKEVLECDQCGSVIRELTEVEAREVARNPYNFIIYCNSCKTDIDWGKL